MRRVLVADDSAVVRLAVSRRLRAAGVDVVELDSCANAAAVDASSIRCALLDFDLGDGLGTEIATLLRERVEALPIAFFTSTSRSQVAHAATFGPVFDKAGDLDAAIAWVLAQA